MIISDPTQSLCAITPVAVTSLQAESQPRLFVVQGHEKQELLLQESLGQLVLPYPVNFPEELREKDMGCASMVVIPLEGGGRGPIINQGETITLSLLLSLLEQVITKQQLDPSLVAELERIGDGMPNTKEQFGYAGHNETITLSHSWLEYPPVIELHLAPGSCLHVEYTHVGVEPDCITYVEIPAQEVIYGHSGIMNSSQFTVKAAILEKAAPVTKAISWSPTAMVGPPLSAVSAESATFTTDAACMGLRVKGTLTLSNALSFPVVGTVYAQMSVDGGAWCNIAAFHYNFKENSPGSFTEAFDVMQAYDHAQHKYKFRGYLVTQSDDEPQRVITGALHIGTVIEFGSGTVLSNDLLLRWASKEKL